MLRAVAGTNVLVSAVLAPGGVCGRLVTAAAAAGEWVLVVSPSLLEEFTAVLSRPKFSFVPGGQVVRFVAVITRVAQVVPDAQQPWPKVSPDPDDDYLVALARDAAVDAWVSGDSDLTGLARSSPLRAAPERVKMSYRNSKRGLVEPKER
jgi:putative PIN family toxin of toxin-antitoxin system